MNVGARARAPMKDRTKEEREREVGRGGRGSDET